MDAIFRGIWETRPRPCLSADDDRELVRQGDPQQPGFALRRPDVRLPQSFTPAPGEVRDNDRTTGAP